jgi:hypothetical protein
MAPRCLNQGEIMRTGNRIGGVLLFTALLAACGDNVQDEMAATALEQSMQPEPVDTQTAAALADELVDATLNEWSIQLSRAEMPAGQVTFRIRNAGQVAHDFEIEPVDDGAAGDPAVDGDAEVEGEIPPGQERLLNVTLTPGTYTIFCEAETEHGDHDELGERTTFTVR